MGSYFFQLSSLSWTRKCNDFDCKMLDLSQADKTVSQNQKVILGSIWTRKCNDFDCKMLNLSQADKTISHNHEVILGSI